SLPALTAASHASRCQAILAIFVTCSPGCGRMISPSLASFASVWAIAAEITALALASAGLSAACWANRPPLIVARAATKAALMVTFVIHMIVHSFGESGEKSISAFRRQGDGPRTESRPSGWLASRRCRPKADRKADFGQKSAQPKYLFFSKKLRLIGIRCGI